MAHIKKVVMHGFKSFAKRTEIPFDNGINVIIGPNGSGKSNISDAICFALGRLSIKSMRAEKARNLIFMGSKYIKPAKEALVEIHFDNIDRAFSFPKSEVVLKRIVRVNGQSIYKVNGETKTRAEVIEMLAQAGIDPYGFNLIMQGQIQSIVKMHPDERRKIIGEVAGISVYEWRKEKSLRELEKTESRLKEISTVLRERTAYLNNLEKEKSQAQRYKNMQQFARRAKASIINKKLEEKKKEVESIIKAIQEKTLQRDRAQEKVEKIQEHIDKLVEKINLINKHVRDATGFEHTQLRDQITNFKAELEGLKVRKEGYENKREGVELRIKEMKKSLPEIEKEIAKLREESPPMARKAYELKTKKKELSELEKERKRLYSFKTELRSLRERIEDKRNQVARATAESSSLIKQIEELSKNAIYSSQAECGRSIKTLQHDLSQKRKEISEWGEKELENERIISIAESERKRDEEIKNKVNKIEVCPLCQNKMSSEHKKQVTDSCNEKIKKALEEFEIAHQILLKIKKEKELTHNTIKNLENKINGAEKEFAAMKTIGEKKDSLKKSVDYERLLKSELAVLEKKRNSLERTTEDLTQIDEKYENKILEIEEISSRTEEDIDTTLLYKEREVEKIKNIVVHSRGDVESLDAQIQDLESQIQEKESQLTETEKNEAELNARFNRLYAEREKTQREVQELSIKLSTMQSEVRQFEDQINYLKIGKAKIDGEKETIEMELVEYAGFELLQGSIKQIEERFRKAQEVIANIGSINMRALEVYDQVKKNYDTVKEKVDTIEKEKSEIVKVIEEIDKRKKKIFMKTFKAVNEIFSSNFSKLSAKGTAYLEIENKEDISEGGIDIVVKMAKGKYFDVHSLSGGEQTLVALSLLFAIQEHKPYHFYILDEIDAALDKRNSERLADLLKQYTRVGQYIIVTHNDAVILDSNVLYGVSMHEGISKILSLRLNGEQSVNQKN